MRLLFVEPPRSFWFVMGEYLPPPFGILQLAAYVEREVKDLEIDVVDCTAHDVSWSALPNIIDDITPDVVAVSNFATCTTYSVVRVLETAKKVNPEILTVTGGQHFTATSQQSLERYPEIDVIVRGEGEQTFTELVHSIQQDHPWSTVQGLSFQQQGDIYHTPSRPLLPNLNELPFPGYHFVNDVVRKYHFAAMAGYDAPYALVEGARGCSHRCTFCSQWQHWGATCRVKTPERIADEIAYCYHQFGSRFIWLTDDDFGPGGRAKQLADALLHHQLGDDLMLFVQWRCDDVIKHAEILPRLRKAGLYWVMVGVETPQQSTLQSYRKGITANDAKQTIQLLKANGIFAHAMFVIGHRTDTHASIQQLREYANALDPDFAIFTALTPFPGTEIYDEAQRNGWIEDTNLSHYDMAYAIMPTETLSRQDVQQELYDCYQSFYGSWTRRIGGLFSRNKLTRHLYRHMLGQSVLQQFKALI